MRNLFSVRKAEPQYFPLKANPGLFMWQDVDWKDGEEENNFKALQSLCITQSHSIGCNSTTVSACQLTSSPSLPLQSYSYNTDGVFRLSLSAPFQTLLLQVLQKMYYRCYTCLHMRRATDNPKSNKNTLTLKICSAAFWDTNTKSC